MRRLEGSGEVARLREQSRSNPPQPASLVTFLPGQESHPPEEPAPSDLQKAFEIPSQAADRRQLSQRESQGVDDERGHEPGAPNGVTTPAGLSGPNRQRGHPRRRRIFLEKNAEKCENFPLLLGKLML